MLHFQRFGDLNIYRPHPVSEIRLRFEAEKDLRDNYAPGEYRDREIINEIIQHRFDFFENQLRTLLPQVVTRDFLAFALQQYELSHEIEENFKENKLTQDEANLWVKMGPIYRRAIKYLAECMTLHQLLDQVTLSDEKRFEICDRCWSCCEQLVEHSFLSAQTYAIFPDRSKLTLHPQGSDPYIELAVDEYEFFAAFNDRMARDRVGREKYLGSSHMIFDPVRIGPHLDKIMERSCGFSYTQALLIAGELNDGAQPAPNGFPIPFIQKKYAADKIATSFGIKPEAAGLLLDGLSVRKEAMEAEGRAVWKPKQEHRAGCRPFFQFSHATGTHIIWSKAMFRECILMLHASLAFRHFPAEWVRDPSTKKEVEKYAQQINREFEDAVIDNLRKAGVASSRFKDSIGQQSRRIRIPPSIGEIDLLAFDQKQSVLIVGECKMVRWTSEPATFRDDLSKFLKDDGYVCQVEAKSKWISDNLSSVVSALESEAIFPDKIEVCRSTPVIVTYYPTFASCFIQNLPCVSITELMEDYKNKNGWPYPTVPE